MIAVIYLDHNATTILVEGRCCISGMNGYWAMARGWMPRSAVGSKT
jgi:hypothetical protein